MGKHKKDKEVDNIEIFKKLTKNNKGQVDIIIFEMLIEKFENFILFKSMYVNDNHGIIIKGAKKDNRNIKFIIEFKSSKILNEFINDNESKEITLKRDKFTPIFNIIKKNSTEVYFKKRK